MPFFRTRLFAARRAAEPTLPSGDHLLRTWVMQRGSTKAKRNFAPVALLTAAAVVMAWSVSDQSRHVYWIWAAACQVAAVFAVLRQGSGRDSGSGSSDDV
jgi:hypothetical protein